MVFGVSGCYLVGRGVRIGWLIFAVASGINIYLGFHSGIMGMAVASSFYLFLELKGWWQHHHPKKDKK